MAVSAHANELLDLTNSLEDIVGDLVKKDKRPAKSSKRTARGTKKNLYGMRQMQQTYLEMGRAHLNPVARYVKAIKMGVVTKDMVEVMVLIVGPLVKKTKQVGLDEIARKLRSLHVVFTRNLQRKVFSHHPPTRSGAR